MLTHYKSHKVLFIIIFLLTFGFSAVGSAVEVESLLVQSSRPTVAQVQELLKTWDPGQLEVQKELPRDKEVTGAENLHYNYPLWFTQLIKGAPRMIATFEKAFPGATFAFIGRDMAILADLFEAFYQSLGQTDRVVRVGMSRGSLVGWDDKLGQEFLTSLGVSFKSPQHPFILVDAISRGGGRQGRALLGAAFHYFNKNIAKLGSWVWYMNFVGLQVATTGDSFIDISSVYPTLLAQENFVREGKISDYQSQHPIFVYSDGRSPGTYIGINESGYSHWTGVWHGPFGQLQSGNSGKIEATPGPLESKEMQVSAQAIRLAILKYQAFVIRAAQQPQLLKNVKMEAATLGYQFPEARPYYVAKPIAELTRQIEQAASIKELTAAINHYESYNLGRIPIGQLDVSVIGRVFQNMSSQSESVSKGLSLSDVLRILSKSYLKPDHQDPSATLALSESLAVHPLVFATALSKVRTESELKSVLQAVGAKLNVGQEVSLVKALPQVATLLADGKGVREIAALLSIDGQVTLVNQYLKKGNLTVDGYLGAVNNPGFNVKVRKQLIGGNIDSFFSHAPNVGQINQLIGLTKRGCRVHQEILVRAFQNIQSRGEYDKLVKPSFFRKKKFYRQAEEELKKRHPGWF